MPTTPRSICLLIGLLAGCLLVLGGCSGESSRERPSGLRYQVEPGDSLSTIARRAGLPVATVIRANDLQSRSLRPGQVLVLPGVREMGSDPLDRRFEPAPQSLPQPTGPRVVSRAQWGARPIGPNHDPMPSITRITVHHTHDIPGMTSDSDVNLVRRVERFHMDQRGWAGIGYHYLIGRDGTVYEGRPASIQGAHARGRNNIQNLGIALIGDFDERLPPAVQMAGFERFLDQMRSRYQVPAARVYGHRDFVVTECPGQAMYDWLIAYRQRNR